MRLYQPKLWVDQRCWGIWTGTRVGCCYWAKCCTVNREAPLRGPNYLPCVHTGYHYYKIWWPFDVPIEAILLIAEIFNPSLLILLKTRFEGSWPVLWSLPAYKTPKLTTKLFTGHTLGGLLIQMQTITFQSSDMRRKQNSGKSMYFPLLVVLLGVSGLFPKGGETKCLSQTSSPPLESTGNIKCY